MHGAALKIVGNLYPSQSLPTFQGLFSVYSRFNFRYKLFECILIVMLTHAEKSHVERTFRLVSIYSQTSYKRRVVTECTIGSAMNDGRKYVFLTCRIRRRIHAALLTKM
jgi:hypothetical protein